MEVGVGVGVDVGVGVGVGSVSVSVIVIVCVLFLYSLKWLKSKNFYETIHERYGHDTLKTARRYEKDLSRYSKVAFDITFLQNCRLLYLLIIVVHR